MTGSLSFDQNTRTLTIGSVKMTVIRGDITKDGAEAIVNSTDEKMSMSGK